MLIASDRRKYPRKEVNEETLYLISEEPGRVYTLGSITDISPGGLCVHSGFPHGIGEQLVFEVVRSRTGGRIVANVKWAVNEKEGSDQFKIGLEFA